MDASNLKPKPTHNEITIKKNVSKKPLECPNHELDPNPLVQHIRWNLYGPLQLGDFTSFKWIGQNPPPAGIFGPPEISYDGNSLTITAFNVGMTNRVEYPYEITVKLGTETYSTHDPEAALMVRDPIIINK